MKQYASYVLRRDVNTTSARFRMTGCRLVRTGNTHLGSSHFSLRSTAQCSSMYCRLSRCSHFCRKQHKCHQWPFPCSSQANLPCLWDDVADQSRWLQHGEPGAGTARMLSDLMGAKKQKPSPAIGPIGRAGLQELQSPELRTHLAFAFATHH
jgi:hypothetical protein